MIRKGVVSVLMSLLFLAGCAVDTKLSSSQLPTSKVANVLTVNTESFGKVVLGSKIPVLVDFYATWCGPCKLMAPIVDDLASRYTGQIKVARVDVDLNPGLAQRYDVYAVPMIGIFENGSLNKRAIGVVSMADLALEINQILDKNKSVGSAKITKPAI